MNIKEALQKLEPANNEHWTADGLPLLDAVQNICGQAVTRAQVTEAWPGFSRALAKKTTTQPTESEQQEVNHIKPSTQVSPDETKQPDLENSIVTGTDSQVFEDCEQDPIAQALEKVNAARVVAAQAQTSFQIAQKEYDVLVTQAQDKHGANTNNLAIQDYLKAQKNTLQQKAKLKADLAANGINLAQLGKTIEVSALDQALKGKR